MRGIVFGFLYFLFFNSVIFTQEIIENTEKPLIDNSPSLKCGDSPTYTPRGFRVWSSCFPVATNVSTPQADTECPSANTMYSSLRYKKQEKFAPFIPIAKARGFTALSGKNASRVLKLKEVMRIKDEPGKFYFRAPHDIKIAKNGSIFINDYRGNNFLNISHDGKFFKNLYKKGEGPGEIRDYFKYALSQNEIYIYDFIKRKIICIEQEGSLINEFKTYTEKYNRFKGIFGDWLVLMKKVLPAKRDKVQMYQDKNTIVLLSKDGKKNKESHVFLNKTFYIANRGIVPWDPFVSVLAENSGCLYVSCSREYMIHMLDLNRGKVMRSFKRKYKRVRYEMSQDEDKFMKRVNAPRKKYERDINRLHLFNGLLWVETSTKDEKKGIMIDVFNNKGQFLDNFYLALDGDLISVQDNFIFVKELDEEGNIVVKKYIIEEEN